MKRKSNGPSAESDDSCELLFARLENAKKERRRILTTDELILKDYDYAHEERDEVADKQEIEVRKFFIIADGHRLERLHCIDRSFSMALVGDAQIHDNDYLIYVKFGDPFVCWDESFGIEYVGVTSYHEVNGKNQHRYYKLDMDTIPEYNHYFEEFIQICTIAGRIFNLAKEAEYGGPSMDDDNNNDEDEMVGEDDDGALERVRDRWQQQNKISEMDIREEFDALCRQNGVINERRRKKIAQFIVDQAVDLDKATRAIPDDNEYLTCTKVVYQYIKLSSYDVEKLGFEIGIWDEMRTRLSLKGTRKYVQKNVPFRTDYGGRAKRPDHVDSAPTATTAVTESVIGRHIPILVDLKSDEAAKLMPDSIEEKEVPKSGATTVKMLLEKLPRKRKPQPEELADWVENLPESSDLKRRFCETDAEEGGTSDSDLMRRLLREYWRQHSEPDGSSVARHYQSAKLSTVDDCSVFSVRERDFVELFSGQIFCVTNLWKQNGRANFHGIELILAADTALGDIAHEQELFLLRNCSTFDYRDVVRKIQVRHRKIPSRDEFENCTSASLVERYNERFWDSELDEGVYFVAQVYDEVKLRFEYDDETLSLLFSPKTRGRCEMCAKNLKQAEYTRPVVIRENKFAYQGHVWTKGTCILLQSDVLRDRLAFVAGQRFYLDEATFQSRLKRYRSNPKTYPEFDRFERNRDLNDERLQRIARPLTVAQISDCRCSPDADIELKLRVFYRPEDTKMSDDEVRGIHPGELYLSKEAYWITLSDDMLERTSGVCYVSSDATLVADQVMLRRWFDGGAKRFYCIRELSADYLPGEYLSEEMIANVSQSCVNDDCDQYNNDLTRPLVSLDLFAGVGGLTLGLEQSGIARCAYAVEFELEHALVFGRNFPNARVFCADVNGLFEDISSGKETDRDGRPYPKKGEIELIVGGPPCQGFSGLNTSKTGTAAKEKRSQVAGFMAYVDYFRPSHVLMENVSGMGNAVDGVELVPVLIECLRSMQYQVTVAKLQVAQYGVPQDRRRILVMATAPGERLPDWPLPSTSCSKALMACSIFSDSRKKQLEFNGIPFEAPYHTAAKYEAPYRGITVRDAIDDLPVMEMDRAERTYYALKCNTYYQSTLRCADGSIFDHTTESLGVLKLARVEHIPLADEVPGADWRFLPNIVVPLNDGSVTNAIVYKFGAHVFLGGKKLPNRGFCEWCSGTSKCERDDRHLPKNTLIPAPLPHNGVRFNQWRGLFGRVELDGHFPTIITNPEPMSKQGRVLHPTEHRLLSVREFARGQSFPDTFRFSFDDDEDIEHIRPANGDLQSRFIQIGNAVPPSLARHIGLAIGRAIGHRKS